MLGQSVFGTEMMSSWKNNSTQHEEGSVVLTGVKHKEDHEAEVKSAFPVLRLASPVTTQYKLTFEKTLW